MQALQINQTSAIARPRVLADVCSFIIGALLPLAFAPFHVYILAIICPALVLILWLAISPKRAFLRGWLFGLGFFGTGISWVFVSIHTYGQAPIVLALLITLIFIMFLALFPALQGYVLNRWFPISNGTKCLLAFPALWVLLEWVREWMLTGFPWLFLGYSQMDSPLRGLAPIIGVYGLSWAVVLTAGALVYLFLPKKRFIQILLIGLIAILWVGSAFLLKVNWTAEHGKVIKISMIQGDVPQELKWDPDQIINTLKLYRSLTETQWGNNIIIWPEAAITVLQNQAQDFLDVMSNEAKANNATIITGIPIEKDNRYYNGMIAIGDSNAIYLKRHLVPFGEFMPLRWALNWLKDFILIPMSDLSSGPKHQPTFVVNGLTVAPFICYEIAYPNEVLDLFPQAQLIITLTDDSWFGKSIAPAQHLQMAQMRALETGRYLLNSTNNGVTAIINPHGQILNFAYPFKKSILAGQVFAMTGETPLMIIGIYPIVIFMALLLIIALISQRFAQPKDKP